MSSDSAGIERRSGQRFALYVPLTLHVNGRSVPGYAQDISARGVLLVAEVSASEGTVLELTFTMPAEITLGDTMRVRARGRVLRSASAPAGTTSTLAVQFDSFQYLPSTDEEGATDLTRISDDPSSARSGIAPR